MDTNDAEYVARMEDVLDLYAEAPDPKRPGVCFKEARPSSSAKCGRISVAPGWLQRYGCEYKRNGTANLFVFLDAHHS
ncbi:hypothetical protein ABIA22_006531 [Sinorhizobium fredii]|nr:hypothetical protein AB395_00005561 [Sinorhizobium fredii CCBAU 45436]